MNYLFKRCQKSSYGGCMHKGGGEHGVLGSIYKEREEEISVRSVGGRCPDPQTITDYYWISINLFTRMMRHLA